MHATEPRTEKKFTTLTKRCKMIPRLLQIIKQGKDDQQNLVLERGDIAGGEGEGEGSPSTSMLQTEVPPQQTRYKRPP